MIGASMHQIDPNEDANGIVTLLKETADGFGCLMAAHVKLARLELLADVKSLGRRLTMLVAVVSFAFFGYALVCMGLVVVISQWLGIQGALFLAGGVHLAGATSVLFVAVRGLRNADLMPETAHEAGRSVSSLTKRIVHGQAQAASAPERTASGALVIRASGSGRAAHCGAAPVNGACR